MNADKLIGFRQTAYKCLGRAQDAMFELKDAILSSPRVNSFAELSCSPLFRRQWSSLYEALQDSRPQRRKLMRLYIEQMRPGERPVIAGDHTLWARPYAMTLQERTYEHQATMLGNRPVGVGQGWSTLVWIPAIGSSWALPLRHERITSFESPISKVPHLGTAKQAERWSDLMPLLSWQLWLARDLVTDRPLPWQKPQAHLTPGQVAQAMSALFTQLGTPAQASKPR
jgi:hypothetical protein